MVSPSVEKQRETTTATAKFDRLSPDGSTAAGNMNPAAVAAAAALSHQRMLMSPLHFDRVSNSAAFLPQKQWRDFPISPSTCPTSLLAFFY